MDGFLQDLRHAARRLRRAPGSTALVLLTLALGIGAATAIYGVVRAALLRPLPYPNAERVLALSHQSREESVLQGMFSPPDFADLARESRAFSHLAAYLYQPGQTGMNLTGGGEPLRVATAPVSTHFFTVLGTPPALGRAPLPEEQVEGADRVAVLSDGLWRRRFGSDPAVVGRTVELDGEPFTVVGVMPTDFAFPAPEVEVWVPITVIGEDDIPTLRDLRWMSVIGLLREGATPEAARAETSAILARLAAEHPGTNGGWDSAGARSLRDLLVGEVRPALLLLFGAVALVLLIACVNVANLALARATSRERELALRSALGAGRGRLVLQLLADNLILAGLGTLLGLGLAVGATGAMVRLAGREIALPGPVALDLPVLGFAAALALGTAVLTSVLPAWGLTRLDAQVSLREGGRAGSEGPRRQGARAALVVAETALSVVLLVGSVLMVRSFWQLVNVDPGFRSEGVLSLSITVDESKYSGATGLAQRHLEIVDRVARVPGVVAVGASKTQPLHGGGEPYEFAIEGREGPAATLRPRSGVYMVTPGYFRALEIPVLGGRDFTGRDGVEGGPVVILNQALARQYWPDGDPFDAVLRIGEARARVVGIVGDVRNDGLQQEAAPALYLPITLAPRATQKLLVRTAGDPRALLPAVRAAIHEVDPTQPLSDVATLRQAVGETVARPRLLATLLALFGAVATVLAAVGLYGVLSYTVGRRTREIGIRMALGADRQEVVRLVVSQAGAMAGLGLLLGAAGALALARTLRGLLFQVSPTDPATFATVAALLAAVALVAALVPARRATRVDPIVALRAE